MTYTRTDYEAYERRLLGEALREFFMGVTYDALRAEKEHAAYYLAAMRDADNRWVYWSNMAARADSGRWYEEAWKQRERAEQAEAEAIHARNGFWGRTAARLTQERAELRAEIELLKRERAEADRLNATQGANIHRLTQALVDAGNATVDVQQELAIAKEGLRVAMKMGDDMRAEVARLTAAMPSAEEREDLEYVVALNVEDSPCKRWLSRLPAPVATERGE